MRRQRLLRLLSRIAAEGSANLQAQADRLGVSTDLLQQYLSTRPLPDEVARDIEWVLHLPRGWLDGAPDALVDPHGSA
jgi:hypothetical protein